MLTANPTLPLFVSRTHIDLTTGEDHEARARVFALHFADAGSAVEIFVGQRRVDYLCETLMTLGDAAARQRLHVTVLGDPATAGRWVEALAAHVAYRQGAGQ